MQEPPAGLQLSGPSWEVIRGAAPTVNLPPGPWAPHLGVEGGRVTRRLQVLSKGCLGQGMQVLQLHGTVQSSHSHGRTS